MNRRVQELCESRGGRPGLSVLMSLAVSVDVKQHWTMLLHWSQFVPNMSTDIRGHEALLHHLCESQNSGAVWKSRWTSWDPVPNKPTVSVDVKQHFNFANRSPFDLVTIPLLSGFFLLLFSFSLSFLPFHSVMLLGLVESMQWTLNQSRPQFVRNMTRGRRITLGSNSTR